MTTNKHSYPDLEVDPYKKTSPGLHELTRVNSGQPEKIIKKISEVLIFHMKKLRNKIHVNIDYTCYK
jgi:hypothetical protein